MQERKKNPCLHLQACSHPVLPRAHNISVKRESLMGTQSANTLGNHSTVVIYVGIMKVGLRFPESNLSSKNQLIFTF